MSKETKESKADRELLDHLEEALGFESEDRVDVYLTRMPGRVFIETLPGAGFSIEAVKERYGGGKYQARLKVNGKWAPGVRSYSFEIDGPPKSPVDPADDVTKALQDQLADLKSQLEKSQSREDPMALGLQFAQITTSMMTAVMGPMMAALTKQNQGGQPPLTVSEVLKLFRELNDMKQPEIGGEFGDVLQHFGLPLLGEIRKIREREERAPVQQSRRLENPKPEPSANGNGSTSEDKAETPEEVFAKLGAWTTHWAELEHPADHWADTFILTAPEEHIALAAQVMARTGSAQATIDLWSKIAPQIVPHAEWHRVFIERVAENLAAARDDSEAAPEGGSGDHGDAADHAEVGA